MIDMKELNNHDPIKRVAERQNEQPEFSPMDPPDAYSPPNQEEVPFEEMPQFIQDLMREHEAAIERITAFEEVLKTLRNEGVTRELAESGATGDFYHFLDESALEHNSVEEKLLFPLLKERLLANGEHGQGESQRTSVDLLEGDHVKIIQLGAVSMNLLSLASRLRDPASRAVTLDLAIAQAEELCETFRLHIFREDHVVFPAAKRLITEEEFASMTEDRPHLFG